MDTSTTPSSPRREQVTSAEGDVDRLATGSGNQLAPLSTTIDGLVPLPTDFDPDAFANEDGVLALVEAPVPEPVFQDRPSHTAAMEDPGSPGIKAEDAALVPAPMDKSLSKESPMPSFPGGQAIVDSRVIEPILVSEKPDEVEEEEVEEVEERVEEREEVNDPVLMNILQSLQANREEEPDKDGPEPNEPDQDPFGSPLSDLPELPTELPPSPEPPTPPALPSPTPVVISKSKFKAPKATVITVSRATPAGPSKSSQSVSKPAGSPELPKGKKRKTFDEAADAQASEGRERLQPESTAKGHEKSLEDGADEEGAVKDPGSLSKLEAKSKELGLQRAGKKHKAAAGKPKPARVILRPSHEQGPAASSTILDATRPKSYTIAQLKKLLKGKDTETQIGPCLRERYSPWGKCTQCVSKVGGDACRFRDYRVFPLDPKTANITGPGYFVSTQWKDDMTQLPRQFNVPLTEEHMRRTEETAAPLLLPLITREIRHVVKNQAITRETDAAKHRAVCDFCSSTIFGGWFFCKKCGRDYCLACERYFCDSMDTMGQSPWQLPDAARPRLLRCTIQPVDHEPGKPKPNKAFHVRTHLQPVSRFSEQELRNHWLSLADFVLGTPQSVGDRLKMLGLSAADDEMVRHMQDWAATLPPRSERTPAILGQEEVQALYTKTTHFDAEPISDSAGLDESNRSFVFIEDEKLTLDVFDQLWARGEPIVVDKVGAKLKMSWTPDDFIDRFGDELCIVVDCQTNGSEAKTIRSFFENFKDRENRPKAIMKLKDWPQTEDFAHTHSDLYNDFCDALPAPNFTRREGVLNMYAHFPSGPTRPDIGPKMYNAFEVADTGGGSGSTRLHMDVADAVNVMLYASPRSNGQPGCAVWDLFRAEDSDKIRQFLTRKFGSTHKFTDPIHSQLFYLNAKMRKELHERHGVVSWRVYQYPGQAVFIPAGCAHQVCNLADCIKIALDFVSPHNVSRCQQLTQDFRTENFVKAWKDDVLQLYNVLWYAWTNVRETRERGIEDKRKKFEEDEARAAKFESLQNGQFDLMPFTPSRFGSHRHSSAGIAPNVSSVRDEENTRSPSIPQSRATSATPPPTTINDIGRQSDTVKEDASTADATQDERKLSASRIFAETLLTATLAASEPPPPPEARAPSAATKWTSKFNLAPATIPRNLHNMVKKERSPAASRISTSQLIKLGALPLDLAVSAATLQMGAGTDDEDDDMLGNGGNGSKDEAVSILPTDLTAGYPGSGVADDETAGLGRPEAEAEKLTANSPVPDKIQASVSDVPAGSSRPEEGQSRIGPEPTAGDVDEAVSVAAVERTEEKKQDEQDEIMD